MRGAKCLAALAGVSRLGGSRGVPVLVPVRASPVPSVVREKKFVEKRNVSLSHQRSRRGISNLVPLCVSRALVDVQHGM